MSNLARALALAVWALLGPSLALGAPDASPEPAARPSPLEPVDTSSPSATFQSFVTSARMLGDAYESYLSHKTAAKAAAMLADIDRLRALLDLEPLPPAVRFKAGGAAFGYLVDILDRLPAVPAADIPGAPGRDWGKLPDKWRVPGTGITIARVKSGPRAGEYLFTADTVEHLPDDHRRIIHEPPLRPVRFENWHQEQVNFTGPFFSHALLSRLPASLKFPLLDTPAWKVALSLALVGAVFLLTWAWSRLARRLGRGGGMVRRLGARLTIPVVFLGLYFLVVVFIRSQINLSGAFAWGEGYVSTALLYAAGAWAVWIAWFFVVETIIAAPQIPEHSYDAHLLRLTARLGAALSAGALLVYGANAVGIPALGLVAGLGIGGFALALASKSSVENLFGGLALFADRPFRVGDYITYDAGAGGWVETIGSRSTRIRALDGTMITVPNGEMANMHINNISRRTKCLFQHEIGVRYETSPAQITHLVGKIHERLNAHPLVDKTPGFLRVALTGFGASSINILVRAHVLTPDLWTFLKIQERLLLDIMGLVEEVGTSFAFPSQTTYLARDGGIDLAIQQQIAAAHAAERTP